jgi:hypothetical protein
MIVKAYRRMCARCDGPVMVREMDEGMSSVVICPDCSGMPELRESIALLPTLTFLEHAEKCIVCRFPALMCAEGLERLADYPGAWRAM